MWPGMYLCYLVVSHSSDVWSDLGLERLRARVRGREHNIPKKRQTDVDQEISTTSSDCVDTNGRNYLLLASAIDGSMMARGLTKQGDEDQEYRRNHTHLACR